MSTGFCSSGNARPWRRWWRGLPATAIAVKTPTISTASGGCGRSMGGFAFHEANRSRGSGGPGSSESGQAATRAFFGATVRYANAAGAERVVSIVGTDEIDLNSKPHQLGATSGARVDEVGSW